MEENTYLTVKEVASLMRVNERTVVRWVRLGRLTPVRMGHTWRFERSKLLIQLERFEFGDNSKQDSAFG